METTTDEINIHANTPTENLLNNMPLKTANKESIDKEYITLQDIYIPRSHLLKIPHHLQQSIVLEID